MSLKSRISCNQAGFTMVELFATVLIIALLAAIVLGVAAGANAKASIAKAKADLQLLAGAATEIKAVKGYYPSDLATLLTEATAVGLPEPNDKDPWGRDYVYQLDSPRQFTVYSKGPDGRDANSDENLDNVTM